MSQQLLNERGRVLASAVTAAVFAILLGGCGAGDVTVSGCQELSSDINETLELDGCYHFTQSVTVRADGEVTIAPGSTLMFADGAGLEVRDGTLNATGTEEDPILFTRANDTQGPWLGLRFRSTNSTNNRLVHTIVEGAGGEQRFYDHSSVALTGSSPVRVAIEHSTIRDGDGLGIFTEGAAILEEFSNNTITGHDSAPVAVRKRVVTYLDASTDYQGNGEDFVRILASHGNTLEEDGTWVPLNVPYRVRGPVDIRGDALVNIEAGAEFYFDAGTFIQVRNGRLHLNGTADAKVALQGWEDLDTFWNGILYRDTVSADNQLTHVTFANAGGDDDGAQLLIAASGGDASVGLDTVTFEDGLPALYLGGGASISSCVGLDITAGDVEGSGDASACGL